MSQINVQSPMTAMVLEILVKQGDKVTKGQTLMIIEAMKMENEIKAPSSGIIDTIQVKLDDQVDKAQNLITINTVLHQASSIASQAESNNLQNSHQQLNELNERKKFLYDQSRPEAVEKHHKKGKRTARENIEDLVDPDSFVEYGGLTIAAQRSRRSTDDLIKNTPADGLVAGIASVNGELYSPEDAQCFVLSYDYTVLAGTQGTMGHKKTDRVLLQAERTGSPIIFFVEGGGGRPGDTDFMGVGGLDVMTFYQFAKLSGKQPRIAIVSGYCFAGNAAIAGCADVIIATKNSSLGLGGPAMIEGGGLGQFHPREVGPSDVQSENGVIDLLVEDEEEAVQAAKQYLSYFQGPISDFSSHPQASLRELIPDNRRRSFDVRKIITGLADKDSVMELRRDFGKGMITAFIRVQGIPLGLIANSSEHLGGAIDSNGADKASRFMQLCDTFGLPILSLCDTPGFMVGPENEKSASVRHCSRMFVTGAQISVPLMTIVLRRGYGLGAMAMAGGSFAASLFTVSWPTGEFGGMGLEGAVKLGYRKELEAIQDDADRQARYDELVAKAYEHGKAIHTAECLEIDDVIDPADSRKWIMKGLLQKRQKASGKRGFVDTW